jgi:hypothetical protein
MAVDPFASSAEPLYGPADDAVAVTPSDSTDLATVTRALYVGGAGAVAVQMLGGEEVTFAAVPAGTVLPVRVQRVMASGTTATLIIALW